MVDELRELIVRAAPDPLQAHPVKTCSPDQQLDAVIPFSSIIVLGVVVAIEDRFGIRVTRRSLEETMKGGPTLAKLSLMIQSLQGNHS